MALQRTVGHESVLQRVHGMVSGRHTDLQKNETDLHDKHDVSARVGTHARALALALAHTHTNARTSCLRRT